MVPHYFHVSIHFFKLKKPFKKVFHHPWQPILVSPAAVPAEHCYQEAHLPGIQTKLILLLGFFNQNAKYFECQDGGKI